jgi:hypothetical protein
MIDKLVVISAGFGINQLGFILAGVMPRVRLEKGIKAGASLV